MSVILATAHNQTILRSDIRHGCLESDPVRPVPTLCFCACSASASASALRLLLRAPVVHRQTRRDETRRETSSCETSAAQARAERHRYGTASFQRTDRQTDGRTLLQEIALLGSAAHFEFLHRGVGLVW